jgi:hypothetical protein
VVVSLLLNWPVVEHGADVNYCASVLPPRRIEYYGTILMYCIDHSYTDIVEYLVKEAKCNINQSLPSAMIQKFFDSPAIHRQGPINSQVSCYHGTPLFRCIRRGVEKIEFTSSGLDHYKPCNQLLDILLPAGADVHIRTKLYRYDGRLAGEGSLISYIIDGIPSNSSSRLQLIKRLLDAKSNVANDDLAMEYTFDKAWPPLLKLLLDSVDSLRYFVARKCQSLAIMT